MFAGLSPARRRLLLGLLTVLVVAVLAGAAAVVVPRLTGDDPAPVSQAELGPVLLVPGYGGSTRSLQPLADRLRAAGRDAEVVAVPGDGTGDLRASADALDDAVDAALAGSTARAVDVVGYSAGGVIARLWAADDGGAARARRIVTLGSPHHGTTLADLAGSLLPGECPVGCQQLATDSPVLRQLNSGDETPDGPSWVSIWSTADTTVTPPDSARLDGALDVAVQSVCADSRVAHGDLPADALVQGMVLAELAAGRAVELGSADCARLRAG